MLLKKRVVTITADDGNSVLLTSSSDEEVFRSLMILLENFANSYSLRGNLCLGNLPTVKSLCMTKIKM